MQNYMLLSLFLSVVPLFLGLFWAKRSLDSNLMLKLLYAYVMGFFAMLAIFECIFFPAAILNLTLKSSAIVYSIALALLMGYSIWRNIFFLQKEFAHNWKRNPINITEWIYIILFLLLFLVQVYYALFYSRTYMADDGYVTFSTSALATNYLNLTNMYTGLYQVRSYLWLFRVIQTFNYFPAYLSLVSNVHPAIVTHTVFYVMVLVLAYSTYIIMAYRLFDERENRFMFLCLIATLYIWGYHSHYSLTFRLLGPNNEGKAILAVVLAPFMMVLLQEILDKGYRTAYGVQLMILSIAACSLTMGGIYTMAALLLAIVIFSTIKYKSIMTLKYLIWGGGFPCFFAGLYLICRFAPV